MSRRPLPVVAVGVLAVLVAAGCFEPADDPGPPTTVRFDGEAAYEAVAALLRDGDQLRPRVPGEPGHAETAQWLAFEAQVPGWLVTLESFTGATYQEHDAGAVTAYRDGPGCAQHRDAVANVTFHNVVAEWDTPSDRLLVLAAHWDQKAHASHDPEMPAAVVPGANDGASGVGVLLQLLWHVAAGDLEPATDLRIVLFDGEDGFEDCHPLAGSIHHAATRADEVDGMILLDMVGDPDARFIRERTSHDSAPALLDLLWTHAGERLAGNLVPLAPGARAHCSVLDDHVPFAERGVPSVDLIDFGRGFDDSGHGSCRFPPWWHTTDDDIHHVDAQMLGAVGDTLWHLLEDEGLADVL